MSIISLFLFVLFFIFIFGFSIIVSIIKAFFGIGQKRTNSNGNQQSSRQKEYTTNKESSERKKKLFDKDEGEYVDYEEVKENE